MVEGYTDLLALVQAGLDNSVASLGTALTIDQAKLINRFTSKVIVVYDSDEAGQNAAKRSADVLTQAGLDARMVILPAGEDPDSLLQRGGKDLLIETLKHDLSFVEFFLTTTLKKQGRDSLLGADNAEKLSAARSLMETIQNIPSAGQRDLLKAELAQTIGIQPHALESELIRFRMRFSEQDDAVNDQRLNVLPEAVPERDLLKSLLAQPQLIGETLPELSPGMFSFQPLRAIFTTLEKATLKGERIDTSSLPERFNDPRIRSFIAEAILPGYDETIDDARNTINEAIKKIKLRELNKQFSELERRIQIAARDGKPLRDLMLESRELTMKMQGLK
jgi:DNA primase